jgi:predicted amidohydrolase YtcJ
MAARLTAYVVVAIVAATLIAGLIVGAQHDDSSGPVDLIVHNAKVYDAGTPPKFAEAIAIRGNKILRVGSEHEVMRYRRPQTVVIDARGATVLPGFNDAHASFIAGGLALAGVTLTGADSIEDLQHRLSDWAGEHPESPWILGTGWTDEITGGPPARGQLDAVVSDRPVALRSQDGRALWVNTRALAAAHITRRTREPRDGIIVRDRRGDPTGLLKGSAAALVQRVIPAQPPDARAQALLAAIEDAHRHGVTSVQDVAGVRDLDVYDSARTSGALAVRMYVGAPAATTSIEDLAAAAQGHPDDPLLKAGLATIAIDAPDDSTAATVGRLVADLEAQGLQPAIEAPSARAVQLALDAYQSVAKARTTARTARARIDDVNDVAPDDLPRLRSLGVIASTPPMRDPSPLAALNDVGSQGARVVFGSDWPRLPLDPLASIGAALTASAAPDDPATPADPAAVRLALESAINAWTSNSAWASFDDQRKGTIKPGMLADLVVLSRDIFKDPSQVASAKVAMTIFDGKVVYRGN